MTSVEVILITFSILMFLLGCCLGYLVGLTYSKNTDTLYRNLYHAAERDVQVLVDLWKNQKYGEPVTPLMQEYLDKWEQQNRKQEETQ